MLTDDHKYLTVDPLQGDDLTMFFISRVVIRFLSPNILWTKRKYGRFIHRLDAGTVQLEGEGDRAVEG